MAEPNTTTINPGQWEYSHEDGDYKVYRSKQDKYFTLEVNPNSGYWFIANSPTNIVSEGTNMALVKQITTTANNGLPASVGSATSDSPRNQTHPNLESSTPRPFEKDRTVIRLASGHPDGAYSGQNVHYGLVTATQDSKGMVTETLPILNSQNKEIAKEVITFSSDENMKRKFETTSPVSTTPGAAIANNESASNGTLSPPNKIHDTTPKPATGINTINQPGPNAAPVDIVSDVGSSIGKNIVSVATDVPVWHVNPNWAPANSGDAAVAGLNTDPANGAYALEQRPDRAVGNSTIFRMSDGTYKTYDPKVGLIDSGTWNNSQWSGSPYANMPPTVSTVTNGSVSTGASPEVVPGAGLGRARPTAVNEQNDTSPVGPVEVTNPKVGPVDDAIAVGPVSITNPKSMPLDPAIASALHQQADQHASMLETKSNDSMALSSPVTLTPAAGTTFHPSNPAVAAAKSEDMFATAPAVTSQSAAPPTPTVAGAVGSAPSPPAYKGGAEVVNVKTLKNGATLTTTASGAQIEQLPGHSAYQVKAPDHTLAATPSITLLDKPSGPLPTAGAGLTAADPTTHIPAHIKGPMAM